MKIIVKVFATFRDLMPEHKNGIIEMVIKDETTAQEILARCGIPDDAPKIILINGVQKTAAALLKDGDTLSVFPPIAGG